MKTEHPTMTEERIAQYLLMCEFLADCASPEGYGHALPPEVVRRAARIMKMVPESQPAW
jgi:hypothetical protein